MAMSSPEPQEGEPKLVRLNKYLADNGIASRRQCDRLIVEGEVMVDGDIVTELGVKVDPTRQRVEIDGVVLKPEGERHRYYLLNKPAGVICTNDRREARKRAIDLVTDRKKGRIYTVGRLDEDSTGLVLLTNDGELANLVSHPRYGVVKTYRAVVKGRVGDATLAKVRRGVHLSEGKALFERVAVKSRSDRHSTLLLVLREGKNRQVRRVFARVGHDVQSLSRVRIGNISDRGLKLGQWRPLTRSEVEGLRRLASEGTPGPPPGRGRRAGGKGRKRPGTRRVPKRPR